MTTLLPEGPPPIPLRIPTGGGKTKKEDSVGDGGKTKMEDIVGDGGKTKMER